jgi:hypothetical protein
VKARQERAHGFVEAARPATGALRIPAAVDEKDCRSSIADMQCEREISNLQAQPRRSMDAW